MAEFRVRRSENKERNMGKRDEIRETFSKKGIAKQA